MPNKTDREEELRNKIEEWKELLKTNNPDKNVNVNKKANIVNEKQKEQDDEDRSI